MENTPSSVIRKKLRRRSRFRLAASADEVPGLGIIGAALITTAATGSEANPSFLFVPGPPTDDAPSAGGS
jgi:hypothetical protein